MRVAGRGLEATLSEGVMSAARPFDVRAYRVTNPELFNKTIAELEMLPRAGPRVHPARSQRRPDSGVAARTCSFGKAT